MRPALRSLKTALLARVQTADLAREFQNRKQGRCLGKRTRGRHAIALQSTRRRFPRCCVELLSASRKVAPIDAEFVAAVAVPRDQGVADPALRTFETDAIANSLSGVFALNERCSLLHQIQAARYPLPEVADSVYRDSGGRQTTSPHEVDGRLRITCFARTAARHGVTGGTASTADFASRVLRAGLAEDCFGEAASTYTFCGKTEPVEYGGSEVGERATHTQIYPGAKPFTPRNDRHVFTRMVG